MGRARGRFTKSERRFSEAALRGKCWSLGDLPDSGLSGLSGVQAQTTPDCVRKRGNEVGWHTAKRNAGGFLQR